MQKNNPDHIEGALNLVTLNAGYNINEEPDREKLLNFLMQGDPPQVVCLQEMRHPQVDALRKSLRIKRKLFPWQNCARSPRSRSTIISAFPITKVAKGTLHIPTEGKWNNEFLTVKIQGIYITSLHLSSRTEATRLSQIQMIKRKLEDAGVWGSGEPHIWAGDFNSLTKEDYDEEGWSNIEEHREEVLTKLLNQNPRTT